MITVRSKQRDQSLLLVQAMTPEPPRKKKSASIKTDKDESKLWGLKPKILDFILVRLLLKGVTYYSTLYAFLLHEFQSFHSSYYSFLICADFHPFPYLPLEL
jgi:hypothetical protein